MLAASYSNKFLEAGCDEAGRGCLAGPVFAAAVILPPGKNFPEFNDSKKLNVRTRQKLKAIIEKEALAWAVESIDPATIDQINILNSSILAMHHAIEKLHLKPELLLIDGNRFKSFPGIPHQCIIKGDGLYQSIAAASILAKTHRDEYMLKIHHLYPVYAWNKNKGYPTLFHREAVLEHGLSEFHRKTFRINGQIRLF